MFEIKKTGKVDDIKNPILIEGLPGMGNVGKIVLDFIIDELKAKKVYNIYSDTFPHSVFVNEDNLVELPKIEIFRKNNLLFLTGDVQPSTEKACYEFCTHVLELFKSLKGKEIITTGGIGLHDIPLKPRIYCTANEKQIVQKYKKLYPKFNDKIHNVVGPIMGVSGLLLGLSREKDIPAISFLAETFGHPTYLGVKGAHEILKGLDTSLKLGLDLGRLNQEIKRIEKEISGASKPKKPSQVKETLPEEKKMPHYDTYIG